MCAVTTARAAQQRTQAQTLSQQSWRRVLGQKQRSANDLNERAVAARLTGKLSATSGIEGGRLDAINYHDQMIKLQVASTFSGGGSPLAARGDSKSKPIDCSVIAFEA